MKLSSKGQSLIEVLAGLAMAVLIVAALVNMVTASLRSSQYAKTSAQATKFAQEAIEWLRSERDATFPWSEFRTSVLGANDVESKTWCIQDIKCGFPLLDGVCDSDEFISSGDCGPTAVNTIFKRELTVLKSLNLDGSLNLNRINVRVRVYWVDQAFQEHESELNTILTDTERWN